MESQLHSSTSNKPVEDSNTSTETAQGKVSRKHKKKLGASSSPHKHRNKDRLQERIKEKKLMTCKECGKRFSEGSHLEQHQKIHLGETPFTCYECGKNFSRRSHLTRHQDTHLRQKYYGVKSTLIRLTNRKWLE